MDSYSKDRVSNLLFEKIDSIILVNAKDDSFHVIKKQGIFEGFLQDEGSYKELVEKLWFHFNESDKKITEDYHVFIPLLGQFKGKYVELIKLKIEDKIHPVKISIYPCDDKKEEYLFTLDSLDDSKYMNDFITDAKVDTIQSSFLFSMYVDLYKDAACNVNVTEMSNDTMNYDVKYSVWRTMIVNMIWPEDQALFNERTDPEYLKKNLAPGRTSSFDCQMKNLEGVYIWVKLIFSRAATTNEEDFRFVFMVQNIHESSIKLFDTLKKYEELASKDPLTSIYNHGRIETEIKNSIESYNSSGKMVSYMMIDIDFFKKVNDQFGHSTGDLVLQHFVKAIVEIIKEYDIKMGRWGGEEFVCVCYDMDIEKVKCLAGLIKDTIAAKDFEKVGRLTCSIGLSQIKKDDTAMVIFDRIDAAMYEAKTSGRNRVIIR